MSSMRSRACNVLIVALLSVAWIPVQARGDTNDDRTKIDFRGGASLIFSQQTNSDEAKKFGFGWKKAVFADSSGNQIQLFPMEFSASPDGVIFSGDYPTRISPSGKYAVLDILRAGVVDSSPMGRAEIYTRQYCPVLDTTSGCVVSLQTGELCGGDWSSKTDEWISTGYKYDATKAMVAYGFAGPNDLWGQFVKSTELNGGAKIKEYLVSNLGITNMMACKPPTGSNRDAYISITRQLKKEDDLADAKYIEDKLNSSVEDAAPYKSIVINVDKIYLHDSPDFNSKSKIYLVRGDEVKVMNTSGDGWLLIEYIERNGTVLHKWMQVPSKNDSKAISYRMR